MSPRPLAVIVPSRGRPESANDLAHTWWTVSCDASDLYIVVDSDDPKLDEYHDALDDAPTGVALVIQETPGNMVKALNRTALHLAKRHFALCFMGDDHRPRTPCWDNIVTESLELMGTGIVTGSDGYREDELPTWCAMSSDIVRILGYMAPPGLVHMYVDNAWKTLGETLERFVYLPSVLVEHMHPVVGKAAMDEGYLRVNSPAIYARDEAAYVHWCTHELADAVEKIKAQIPAGVGE